MQNFAARVVLGLKTFDHISQAIKSLNWLPVNDRIFLNDAVMMYKCINELVPDYLIEKFTLRSQTQTRNTRQRDQLNIPRFQGSPVCRGILSQSQARATPERKPAFAARSLQLDSLLVG